MSHQPKSPVLLCILDGWGHRSHTQDNAISNAKTPCWDKLMQSFPHALIETSGLSVGLPQGQMGNSEVGHMNIGSGRVVMQNLPRIDEAIDNGMLARHAIIDSLVDTLKANDGTCHLLGMLSPGGVHSHQRHLETLVKILAHRGVSVKIHAFLDGRDTPPKSALAFIEQLNSSIKDFPSASIATISGRYYAMDRDKRWNRIQKAYDAMVLAEGHKAKSAIDAIEYNYAQQQTDEFIEPTVIGDYQGVSPGDAMLMANFRSDRARQLLSALLDPEFDGFQREVIPDFSKKIGMVEYSDDLNRLLETLFSMENLKHTLGQVVADRGLHQLRIAETEKYAHVTFFFNGGQEKTFISEQRILVPSPDVKTYDMLPQMASQEVTTKLIEAIDSKKYDLIVVNYANTDMVGHTGNFNAVVKAVEAVDSCLSQLVDAVQEVGGVMLITADHGNAEQMLDITTNQPHTAHTSGPVPIIVLGEQVRDRALKNGKLCDIAPTILDIMHIDQPKEMTGESLMIW